VGRARAAASIAILGLAPGVGLLLPFELGLRAQAGVITAVVAMAAWSGRRHLATAARELPSPVRWGLLLYTVAAVWGTLVGASCGGSARDVAAQSLAMLLLPMAAVAFSTVEALRDRVLWIGLGIATAVALSAHLASLFQTAAGGAVQQGIVEPYRFRLGAGVTLAGAALPALLLTLARLRGQASAAAGVVAVLAGALLIGSLSRGQWAAALLGVVALSVLDRDRWVRAAVMLLLALAAAGAGLALARGWGLKELARLDFDRAPARAEGGRGGEAGELPVAGVLALPDGPARRSKMLIASLDPGAARAVELRARLRGPAGTLARLRLAGEDEAGKTVLEAWLPIPGSGDWTRAGGVVFLAPEVRNLRVGIWSDRGSWLMDELAVSAVGSRAVATLRWWLGRPVKVERRGRQGPTASRWLEAVSGRVGLLVVGLDDPGADSGLGYRLAEWLAIRRHWAQQPWWRRLVGQGLGARFAFVNPSWDAAGRSVRRPNASYVHNLYVFYAFKLGAAGALALAGLLTIVGWTLRQAWSRREVPLRWWLPAGAAATWLAYLLWGLTSPEVVDFRIAPLLGALVAACCTAAGQARERASAAPVNRSGPPPAARPSAPDRSDAGRSTANPAAGGTPG
jgi:hypothetical protein